MILRFDTVIAWQRISQLTMETGEQRTYYLAPLPHRALLVLRNGVTLETARNAVVDVAVGMDRADPGFAHDPGIVQLKITVFRVVRDATPDTTLSALVYRRAPRSDRTS